MELFINEMENLKESIKANVLIVTENIMIFVLIWLCSLHIYAVLH